MLEKHQLELIERGKQIGSSSFFEINGVSHWISVGIQKMDNRFIAHVSFIREADMVCEKFILDETIAFDNLSEALGYMYENIPKEAPPLDLKTRKGLRFFNPLI
jgi:hypothetical protein